MRRELSRLNLSRPCAGCRLHPGCWRLFLDMNLQSTDFELFQLPVQFAQPRELIDARWKELQREAHPDKFAAQGAAAQRLAMQWSVRINEAYQRLKDPLQRAAYLCEMHGAAIRAENNTAMPPAFLIQQMEWREALEDASTLAQLEQIAQETAAAHKTQLAVIEHALDVEKDYAKAARDVRSLMFIQRFVSEIENRIDQLAS